MPWHILCPGRDLQSLPWLWSTFYALAVVYILRPVVYTLCPGLHSMPWPWSTFYALAMVYILCPGLQSALDVIYILRPGSGL